VLELAVLGLLHESPLHGYELRQRLKATLGTFRAFSYGSLYPTLRRMRTAGWIVEDEGDADVVAGAPALTGRRGKVVYKLTADGKERLAELLSEAGPSAWEDETFGVHFALFGQTAPEVRVRILEGRRTRLEERREGVPRHAGPHPLTARPLHPPAAGARAGVGGARGPVAHRAHRDRARSIRPAPTSHPPNERGAP
jgi:DNA-binding PadR family transcriptional regulator